MNVGQLIAQLSTLDAELPVIMPSEKFDFCEVGAASEDIAVFKGWNVQLTYPGDNPAARQVVRLFPRKD